MPEGWVWLHQKAAQVKSLSLWREWPCLTRLETLPVWILIDRSCNANIHSIHLTFEVVARYRRLYKYSYNFSQENNHKADARSNSES